MKWDSFVASDKRFRSSSLLIPCIRSCSLYTVLVQILIVPSRGILVNNESTSKIPITRELSRSTISFENQKVSLTMNSLDVIELILGTKNSGILFDVVPIGKRMSLKE